AMTEFVRRFVALPLPTAQAISLWTAHTYLMDAWMVSPILLISSPVKRCGKTTLLQLVAALVRRGIPTSNITTAALFRCIDAFHPTLLMDEAENFIGDREALIGIINAGHSRHTASVLRTVGDDHDARNFSTWCAKW